MDIRRELVVSALAITLAGGVAVAQEHPDQGQRPDQRQQEQHGQYVHHPEWKKGYHMRHDDWGRGEQVDWHARHLRKPPSGYEWRMVDGNYVCANNRGVIFSVVVGR